MVKQYLEEMKEFVDYVNRVDTGYGLIRFEDLLDLKEVALYYLQTIESVKLTEEKITEYFEVSTILIKIKSTIMQFLFEMAQHDKELEKIGESYTGEFANKNKHFLTPYYDKSTDRHAYSSADMECNPIAAELDRIMEKLKSKINGLIDEELTQPLDLGEGNTFKTIRDCMAYYRNLRKQRLKEAKERTSK